MHRETTYEKWIQAQGLPIVQGYGIECLVDVPRVPWERMGGRGTFVKLHGMEGVTGLYVAEIPPGGALNPEKHLYEEILYVLQGRGSAEVWTPGSDRKTTFEWHEGSLFAMPLNAWHRLYNGSGNEPAVFLGFGNAPMILDIFHNPHFVFNSDYAFDDRFQARRDYFTPQERMWDDLERLWLWKANFVPDVRRAEVDSLESKGSGMRLTQCELGDGVMVAHIADWPNGQYQKAHHHGAGAVLLIVRGQGYTLLWPPEAGTQPYASGHADRVIKVPWREGSVVSPPAGWFHQHMSTGREPARQLALRWGTRVYGVEWVDLQRREGVFVSVKNGGTLIEYEDEDPAIGREFAEECAKNGVEVRMPHLAALSTR